jgi:hypothetical protein
MLHDFLEDNLVSQELSVHSPSPKLTTELSTNNHFPLLIIDTDLWKLDFTEVRIVPPSAVPEPYRKLLVHHLHMTVTVEEFYHQSVDVRVLASSHNGDDYHREILLELQQSKQIVQYGIVRINLSCCSPTVREAILEQKIPLGRILIENNVMRRIEPTAILQIEPGTKLMKWLGMTQPQTTYGRMGVIFCDDQPAIAVLEILTPIP